MFVNNLLNNSFKTRWKVSDILIFLNNFSVESIFFVLVLIGIIVWKEPDDLLIICSSLF